MDVERDHLRRGADVRRSAEAQTLVDHAETADPEVSDDEISKLAQAAQAGHLPAREALIEKLLPLITASARRFRTEGLEQTDLIQEAIVGLLRALERYDPKHGVPFLAYSTWWIRQSLQEARSDFIRPFRLPPKALRQLSQLKSEHQRIYQAEQRSASVAELADRTAIDLGQATALVSADARVRSIDENVYAGEGDLGSLGDLLEDPLSAAAYEDVVDAIAGVQLRALLSELTDREREIVHARFGLDGEAERLVDIGARLGISAERVRQIEERALAKVRRAT
jgi:RNA polymerase sigma factor (sigma-70 family)